MDLILVADSLESTQPLLRVASKSGYRIMKLIESNDDASGYVVSLRPDVLIFISDVVTDRCCGKCEQLLKSNQRQ